jgi:hypothetical protein
MLNGPVVTEFNCDENFALYGSGVMIQKNKPATIRIAQSEDEVNHPEEFFVNGAGNNFAQSKKHDPHSLIQNQINQQAYLDMADQQLDHTIYIVGWKVDEKT